MSEPYRHARAADGRTLEYLTGGEPAGTPLVLQHGTPGAAVPFPLLEREARDRGLHLVMPTRAGYAGSDRLPGRTVADAATDVATVVDDLGHDEFLTLGWSGGGPHALACAALLPERCLAAATGAGVAPWVEDGSLDFLDAMGPENVEEYGLAREGEAALRPYLESEAESMGAGTVEALVASLDGLLSPVDRAALTDEFAARVLASTERAMSRGVDGWVDDDLAFVAPWGVDLASVRVPVTVWQGSEDQFTPSAHGRWLAANVHGAQPRLLDGEGHLSLLARVGEVLDDLVARGGR